MVNWVDGIVNTVGFVSSDAIAEHINMVQMKHNFTINPDEGLSSKRMSLLLCNPPTDIPSLIY